MILNCFHNWIKISFQRLPLWRSSQAAYLYFSRSFECLTMSAEQDVKALFNRSIIYIAPLPEGAPWRYRLGCERHFTTVAITAACRNATYDHPSNHPSIQPTCTFLPTRTRRYYRRGEQQKRTLFLFKLAGYRNIKADFPFVNLSQTLL